MTPASYRAVPGTGFDHRLGEFSRAILDPDLPVPEGLVAPDGRISIKRFAVYRNNVVAGLIDVLRAAYPAVRRIVGDDFFAAMARIHVAECPPESPIVLDYGRAFAGFIASFPPVRALPYLADVARIERAWLEAYHAVEAVPVLSRVLAQIPAARVPSLRLRLHPSLRIVGSDLPALTIWQMNSRAAVPAAVDLAQGGEIALIARPGAEVEVRQVAPEIASFIAALLCGETVLNAVLQGIATSPRFDPTGALAGLGDLGLIVDIETEAPVGRVD